MGAHPLLGFTEQIGAKEPLHLREMAIVEDRSRSNAKIVVALEAVVLLTVGYLRSLRMIAARALDAIPPAERFEIFAALIFIAKLFNKRAEIYGVCHV